MKIPESVVIVWELLVFLFGMVALFLWAVWQDSSAWFLRRIGFRQVADEREALADRTFKDIIGYDLQD